MTMELATRHLEDTLGQGAGLVEDHRLHAAERIHEVGPFYQRPQTVTGRAGKAHTP